jgi:hypothetical protein
VPFVTNVAPLLSDATVECWGMNLWGQFGDGSASDSPAPVRVSWIANAIAIDANDMHL